MLDEKFILKARKELREDENRKKQALEHFREWIKKHPYIKQIRQGKKKAKRVIFYKPRKFIFSDDIFLLQFLRTKKYSRSTTERSERRGMVWPNSQYRFLFSIDCGGVGITYAQDGRRRRKWRRGRRGQWLA